MLAIPGHPGGVREHTTFSVDVIPIQRGDDPRLAPYAGVKQRQRAQGEIPAGDSGGEFGDGSFLAEGELVVGLLLASAYRVRSVLLTPVRLEAMGRALGVLPAGTPVYVAPQDVMTGVVGFHIHRGVLASAERGAGRTMADVVEASPRGLVVMEGLTNADNVGAIFRNTAALGGAGVGVLLSPTCCDPLYRKAIRVSMGHVLRTPWAIAEPWPAALGTLRRAGYEVLGLTPGGEDDLGTMAPPEKPAIVVGSEGPGLSGAALAAVDRRVRIGMGAGVDSLNVGTATALALHRLFPSPA